MILRTLLILSLLAACGRPLTETETQFAKALQGSQLDTSRVRLVKGAPVAAVTFRRKPRPRIACRERILPPVKEAVVTSKPAAVTLFNRVFFVGDWYLDNYMPDYPERMYLIQSMLLAHELTHVWQWQNRGRTGYSPMRAAAEHGSVDDPYLFDLDGAPDFLSYGFEQQGAIVEEYVCCRALAPDAPRTQRLHAMLRESFPVADLPGPQRESNVYLPWKGAELDGICA
ncbi:hypothetical protein [Sedimentitalea nanhaiensis]|uniref:DUF4157 domain-containing protein n=1 Tax=Sedimentitalea nanhaiensis TaxID=999627 RepID=A0A1I6YD36_9RHOB|nr:hypothetical protein [Sedimentitalea nanhaiensis]SFT48300.1 hypothetical protein SAMN05216236_102150 [Sedimentitalea nanhaiensis]